MSDVNHIKLCKINIAPRRDISIPSSLFSCDHDDVIKWKHFPRYWPFVREIQRSPVNSPHKGQWRGALMFSLICTRINGWINSCEAGDLRRHHAHYDVIVMIAPRRTLTCVGSMYHPSIQSLSQAIPSYASVTSNHGPRSILTHVRFLARKADWSARRNFTPVLFSWAHQATGPVRLDTAVHFLWFDQIIRRTPHEPRTMPTRASYRLCTRISNVFHILINYADHKAELNNPMWLHIGAMTELSWLRNAFRITASLSREIHWSPVGFSLCYQHGQAFQQIVESPVI